MCLVVKAQVTIGAKTKNEQNVASGFPFENVTHTCFILHIDFFNIVFTRVKIFTS